MARALWLADALRAAGLNVVEVEGWHSRGGSVFTPSMVLMHHDASSVDTREANMVDVVTNGRAGLKGPIGNVYIGRSCTVYVVASGRSNHAGLGKILAANTRMLGVEVGNNGVGEQWSPQLMETYALVVRALCDGLRVDSSAVFTHASHTKRKIDPAGPTSVAGVGPDTWGLAAVRAWIQPRTPLPKPPPLPLPPQILFGDDDMLTPQQARAFAPTFHQGVGGPNGGPDVYMVGYGENTWMRNGDALEHWQQFHAARWAPFGLTLADFAVIPIGQNEFESIEHSEQNFD